MELQTIKDAVDKVDNRVVQLLEQQAVHNTLLKTHEERSLALQRGQDHLEERIKPIEIHVKGVNWFLKAVGAVAIGVTIQVVVRHFLTR